MNTSEMFPLEVLRAVQKVLDRGATAKVSQDHKGQFHVQEERVKKVNIEEPSHK